jgi:hypothetical protein
VSPDSVDLARCTWVPLVGFVEFDRVDQDEGSPGHFFRWGRTPTLCEVLWSLDIGKPPGRMQRVVVIVPERASL